MEYPADTTQNIRAAALIAGALVGIVGMATGRSLMIYIALAILAVGGALAIRRRVQMRKHDS